MVQVLYKYLILTPMSPRKIHTCASYSQNASMIQTKQGKGLNDSSAVAEHRIPLPEMEGYALTSDDFFPGSSRLIDLQVWMQ